MDLGIFLFMRTQLYPTCQPDAGAGAGGRTDHPISDDPGRFRAGESGSRRCAGNRFGRIALRPGGAAMGVDVTLSRSWIGWDFNRIRRAEINRNIKL